MTPPSFPEDILRDDDVMMVDDSSEQFIENLNIYSNIIIDAPFPLQERETMDMGGQSDSDQEDNSSVLFDIPEETMQTLGSGSESGQLDEPDDYDGFLPDDLATYESYQGVYGSSSSGVGIHDGDLPHVIIRLKEQLLNGYTLPPCPTEPPLQRTLSRAETLALKHYIAWTESHGTVKAYDAHA